MGLWFKAHYTLFEKAKNVALSDAAFRLYLNLIKLGRESSEYGVVSGTVPAIAKLCHMDPRKFLRAVSELLSDVQGKLEGSPEDVWRKSPRSLRDISPTSIVHLTVKDLDYYQSRKPSDQPERTRERVAKHRAREEMYRVTSPIEVETETDKREKKRMLLPCLVDYTPTNTPTSPDKTRRRADWSALHHIVADLEELWGIIPPVDLAAFWSCFTDNGKCAEGCAATAQQADECMWLALDKLRLPIVAGKRSMRGTLKLLRKMFHEDRRVA